MSATATNPRSEVPRHGSVFHAAVVHDFHDALSVEQGRVAAGIVVEP